MPIAVSNARILFVDEVTMLSGSIFDLLHRKLSVIMAGAHGPFRQHLPFGGMTIILSGDLAQVPVVTRGGSDFLQAEAMFSSMQNFGSFQHLPLTQLMRQDPDETQFCRLLDDVRGFDLTTHTLPPESVALLKSRFLQIDPKKCFQEVRDFIGLEGLAIFYRNQFVDQYNFQTARYHCAQLKAKFYTSSATYLVTGSNSHLANRGPRTTIGLDQDIATPRQRVYYMHARLHQETTCLVPDHLFFFKGARVMLLKNIDQPEKMVNGRRGTILNIADLDQSTHARAVTVAFDPLPGELNPKEYTLFRQPVDSLKFPDGKIITMYHFPFKPAYAVTAHKAQGQTLSKVAIDIEHPAFAHGAFYVALSRVRRLSDVMLFSAAPFPPDGPDLHINPFIAQIEHEINGDATEDFAF
jgi:ATP-dependent DNA helicase PIF1